MNFFGVNGGEAIVLIVLALLLLGPEKIPKYTQMLRNWIRQMRVMAKGAKKQFKEETGTDFDEIDWRTYDPRQYDPRRIVKEALSDSIEDFETDLKTVGKFRTNNETDSSPTNPYHSSRNENKITSISEDTSPDKKPGFKTPGKV